jgi:peptidyl-prolyl cis-trans isomerase C
MIGISTQVFFNRVLQMLLVTLLMSNPLNASTELAKINQTVITLEEFNRKYQENLKFFPLKPPSKRAVLEDLIQRELGIQEAKKQALDKSPEIADRMNSILFNSLIEKALSKEIETLRVSDGDAKEFYKKAPVIRTSHILVKLSPQANSEEQKKALDRIKEIQAELRKNKNFSKIAQTYSDGPAAPLGGDIDFQPKDRLDPIYYETALQLKTPGRISEIVRTPFGYQIIQLTAVKPWEMADQSQVKRTTLDDKKAKLFEKFMSKLKADAQVSSHPELLTE